MGGLHFILGGFRGGGPESVRGVPHLHLLLFLGASFLEVFLRVQNTSAVCPFLRKMEKMNGRCSIFYDMPFSGAPRT